MCLPEVGGTLYLLTFSDMSMVGFVLVQEPSVNAMTRFVNDTGSSV